MDFSFLLPLSTLGLSSFLTVWSLRLSKNSRIIMSVPVTILSFGSLASARHIQWPDGGSSTFASYVSIYLLYAIKILTQDHDARLDLVDCYKIWSNARGLPIELSPRSRPTSARRGTRLVFAAKRSTKVAVMVLFHAVVLQKLILWLLGTVKLSDFAPDKEMVSPSTFSGRVSFHEMRVRAVISFQWMWNAYMLLDSAHCILSVFFVLVGLDRPEEWPPLFGSPLWATSIRGFWGRFWHRLTVRLLASYSRVISQRVLGQRPGSEIDKVLVPMLVFLMSGVSHALVGWAIGDGSLSRDVLFFMLNFVGAFCETAVGRMSSTFLRGTFGRLRLLRQVAGYLWVFCFFFTVTPLWLYPKIHHALTQILA